MAQTALQVDSSTITLFTTTSGRGTTLEKWQEEGRYEGKHGHEILSGMLRWKILTTAAKIRQLSTQKGAFSQGFNLGYRQNLHQLSAILTVYGRGCLLCHEERFQIQGLAFHVLCYSKGLVTHTERHSSLKKGKSSIEQGE